MKKVFIVICSVIFLSVSFSACSVNKNLTKSTKTVLTNEKKAELEAAADEVFKVGMAPGMIAVISEDGGKDFVIKRGVSNTLTGESMDENDYFRIASNTKTFTGTVALMLVDEGKYSLDDPISKYLPEYNIPNGDQITIRMLGNMTSGLYNYSDDQSLWSEAAQNNHLKSYTPEDLLKIAFSHPVKFAPGTDYEYCNTNIVLLGLLIEKITGKPVGQVISEKVTQPLNLTHTYWPSSIYLMAPYIHGYSAVNGTLEDATNWNPSWGYAAGQLVSNFDDMKIWAKALVDGKLLSDKMKTERFTWIKDHYGFCVMKAGDWIGHPGTISGYNSHVFYNTKNKITIVLLANTETDLPVEYFSDAFRKILDK